MSRRYRLNASREHYVYYGDGILPRDAASSAPCVEAERCSGNLRILYEYRVCIEESEGLSSKTVQERLRALARMSAYHAHKPFTSYQQADAIAFKNELRTLAGNRSWSTIEHVLHHCERFFEWLPGHPQGACVNSGLAGYFRLSKRESKLARIAEPRDIPTVNEAWMLLQAIGDQTPAQRRDQALFALLVCTGMRISAAISLLGSDLDRKLGTIHQDPRHVRTKAAKNLTTWIIPWDRRFVEYLESWLDERDRLGFGKRDPLFPPCSALNARRTAEQRQQPVECWRTPNPFQSTLRQAHEPAGLSERKITPHCLRSMIVRELIARATDPAQFVALSKNLGHASVAVTLEHYAGMSDEEVQRHLQRFEASAADNREDEERLLIDRIRADAISPEDPEYRRAYDLAKARNEEVRARYKLTDTLR